MLDVHNNRINALHQTHNLIFQFGHYVWRLFEGEVSLICLNFDGRSTNILYLDFGLKPAVFSCLPTP